MPVMSSINGVSMDRRLPPAPLWRRRLLPIGATLVLSACVVMFLQERASQVQVIESARLAPVISGEFGDELALRARVEPMRSVQLDAVEAGLVEEILVHDGAWVAAGDLLYRLHSPEQEQL